MDKDTETTQLTSKWWKSLESGPEIQGFRYGAADMEGRVRTPRFNPAHLATNSKTKDLPLSIQYWSGWLPSPLNWNVYDQWKVFFIWKCHFFTQNSYLSPQAIYINILRVSSIAYCLWSFSWLLSFPVNFYGRLCYNKLSVWFCINHSSCLKSHR